jgi:hypothetical protein
MPVAVIMIGSLGDGLAPPAGKGGAPPGHLPLMGMSLLPLLVMLVVVIGG